MCGGSWLSYGVASRGSELQSRDQLVTVEAPGLPGHPSSTQLDAVVKKKFYASRLQSSVWAESIF